MKRGDRVILEIKRVRRSRIMASSSLELDNLVVRYDKQCTHEGDGITSRYG
jgi:hypothetical protein